MADADQDKSDKPADAKDDDDVEVKFSDGGQREADRAGLCQSPWLLDLENAVARTLVRLLCE